MTTETIFKKGDSWRRKDPRWRWRQSRKPHELTQGFCGEAGDMPEVKLQG
jgi:hypothetical protein